MVCEDCGTETVHRLDGRLCCADCSLARIKPVGHKDDADKPMWHLLDVEFASAMVSILTFGAKKYSPFGWQGVANARERYYDALMRHTNAAWADPGSTDPEHGESHWAAVAVNAAFLWWLDRQPKQTKPETDE